MLQEIGALTISVNAITEVIKRIVKKYWPEKWDYPPPPFIWLITSLAIGIIQAYSFDLLVFPLDKYPYVANVIMSGITLGGAASIVHEVVDR